MAERRENCRGRWDEAERLECSIPPCPVPTVTRDRDDTIAHTIQINYRWLTQPGEAHNEENIITWKFNFYANLASAKFSSWNLPKRFSRFDRSVTFAALWTLSLAAWLGLLCRFWARWEVSICCCCSAQLCCWNSTEKEQKSIKNSDKTCKRRPQRRLQWLTIITQRLQTDWN